MKLINIRIFSGLTILVLLFSGSLFANVDNSNAGTSVFNFLKNQIGARPMAMGGAFTGVADDETSLYYNPSGIVTLEGSHFIAGYNNNIFDMQSGFLGYIHPLGENNKIAAQISYLSYGDFDRTDINGVKDGTFGGSDMLFAFTFARKLKENLQLGITAKFIYSKIDTYSASGFAADIGFKAIVKRDLYDNSPRASVGVMIQHLGTQVSTFIDNGEKESLPLTIRAGGSLMPKGLPLLIAADLVYPTDNDFYVALGVETLKLKPLYLRLGWTSFGSNYKTGTGKDNLAGFSLGFGVEHKRLQISYTFTPQTELGTSHRITLTGGIF